MWVYLLIPFIIFHINIYILVKLRKRGELNTKNFTILTCIPFSLLYFYPITNQLQEFSFARILIWIVITIVHYLINYYIGAIIKIK